VLHYVKSLPVLDVPDDDGSAPSGHNTDCLSREAPTNARGSETALMGKTSPSMPQCPAESVSSVEKISTPTPIEPNQEIEDRLRKALGVKEDSQPSDAHSEKLYRKILNRLFPERHKKSVESEANQ
jgi:hypothetical protein